ncbi:MAG: HAMP domain-containing sensor histidine kinase, partial [Myxococcota bacterium]
FVVYFTILLSGQTVQETKFPLLCLLWLIALVIAWPCCSTYMLFASLAKQPCLVWWVSCLTIGVLQLGVAAALVVWLLGCSMGVVLYWAAGGVVSFGAASLYVPVWAGVMGAFLLVACNSLRDMHKAAAYTQGGMALVLCGFLEHEMRKPLSSCLQKAVNLQGDLPKLVLAYRKAVAAGLVSGQLDEDDCQYIHDAAGDIQRISQAGLHFLNNLLLRIRDPLSRQLRQKVTSLNRCVEQALMHYAFQLGQKQRVHWHRREDAQFVGDPWAIEFVILNLIGNALRHVGSLDEVHIWVEIQGTNVVLHVEDTGAGVSSLRVTQVDQPFYSGHPKGHGLGLALCKDMAESFGGFIAVDSVVKQYFHVMVVLPQKPRDDCANQEGIKA